MFCVAYLQKLYNGSGLFVVNLNDATHSLHILIHRNFQYFKERNSVISLVDIVQTFQSHIFIQIMHHCLQGKNCVLQSKKSQSHIAQIYCFEIKGATAPGIVR